jgi:hypothetical protein
VVLGAALVKNTKIQHKESISLKANTGRVTLKSQSTVFDFLPGGL